jgi:transcriptional regulator with XRE-family HTH domain
MLSIGERIIKIRKARGLKQYELADKIGVKYTLLSRWENGVGYPSLFSAIDLADALDVSLDYLVGRVRKK